MKNPWLSYTVLRLGLFALVFGAFMLLQFNPYFSAIVAAVISFAISLLFLDKQRKAMSEQVSAKLARDKSGSYQDPESDLENQVLDLEVDQKKPEGNQ